MDIVLNKIGNALRYSILWIILSIATCVGGLWIYDTYKISEYHEDITRKCVLLDKMETLEGSRKHLETELNFVLEDEKHRKFDINVGVTDYTQTEIGDTVYFDLMESQIEGNSKISGMDAIAILLFGCSIIALIIFIIAFCVKFTE